MLIFDIETDGFLHVLTTIHCLVIRSVETGRVYRFNHQGTGDGGIETGLHMLMDHPRNIGGHNIIKFDIPAIQKLYPWFTVDQERVIDTIVLSRLIYADTQEWDTRLVKKGKMPSKYYRKHSLEAWGYRLGERKIEYVDWCAQNGIDEPFAAWRPEMEDYCEQDTLTNLRLWEHFQKKQWSERSIRLEHDIAWIIARQERRGICFNMEKAAELYSKLTARQLELQEELRKVFPPFYKKGKEFIPKGNNNKHGYTKGAPLTKVILTEFNPASRDHIALMLKRRYGWEPVEFTGDGKPKVDETILGGLDYPEARVLRDYLTVDKRIGQLATGDEAWMKHERNGRIHGSVTTNGAVTGRMTHAAPNTAQVPASYSPWGKECRELFEPTTGFVMVGIDASALELCDFAGYLARFDEGAYIEVVLRGDKKAGTDIHSVNARALGLDPKKVYFDGETGRDIAKTWFSMGTPAG